MFECGPRTFPRKGLRLENWDRLGEYISESGPNVRGHSQVMSFKLKVSVNAHDKNNIIRIDHTELHFLDASCTEFAFQQRAYALIAYRQSCPASHNDLMSPQG